MTTSTAIATPALNYVVLYVSDLEASRELYKKLGFVHMVSEDGPGFCQFNGGADGILFGLVQTNEHSPAAGVNELYLKTPNIAAMREVVTSKGVEAGPIMEMPFGKIFAVNSADNHPVMVIEG